MKRSTTSLILYLSVVFVSGLLVGGLGYRLYSTQASATASVVEEKPPTPEEWRVRYVSTMTERLALTAEQVVQLNAILDGVKAEYKALEKEAHDAYRPQRKEIRERQHVNTLAILNADQQLEYEKYREERAERWRKHREKKEREKREAAKSE